MPKQIPYIEFIEKKPLDPNRKTKIWDVKNIDSGNLLGNISWYPSWRKYVFSTGAAYYDASCLKLIIGFLDLCNEEYKKQKEA